MTRNEMQLELGNRIATLRINANMTQGDLARRVRVARTSIVNIEAGRQGVDVWRLLQIAAALHVDPRVFLAQSFEHTPKRNVVNPERPPGGYRQLKARIVGLESMLAMARETARP